MTSAPCHDQCLQVSPIEVWLRQEGDRLSSAYSIGKIRLDKIAEALGAPITFSPNIHGSGMLTKTDLGLSIIVKGNPGQRLWSPHQRFSVAHEIAHILLIKHWQFNPVQSNKREYYYCEELCNMFAGRLLIARQALKNISIRSAFDGITAVCRLAAECGVSKEVSARELVKEWKGLTVTLIFKNKNNSGWVVDWCIRGVDAKKVVRKKRLPTEDPEVGFTEWECLARRVSIQDLEVARILADSNSQSYLFTAINKTPASEVPA